MKRTLGAATLAAAALAAGGAEAAKIVAPVSVTVTRGGVVNPSFAVDNVIDQSGLLQFYEAGVTEFEDYLAGDPRHNDSINTRWLSRESTTSARLVFDFGSEVSLGAFAFWDDYSTTNSRFRFTSLDGLTTYADLRVADPSERGGGARAYDLRPFTARYVALEIEGCDDPAKPHTWSGCGLQEIIFAEAAAGVPEPATWAMMILGFGAAGSAIRRRRGAAAAA